MRRESQSALRELRIEPSIVASIMRTHNGMRPQDIVILLKIIAKSSQPWQNRDLAKELFISTSEVSESLYRSSLAGLIDAYDRKTVNKQALMEFIEHGLKYVFPVEPGSMSIGVYTAHAHPYMRGQIKTESLAYVWPDAGGRVRGLAERPLYPQQVQAVRQDDKLYLMLALVDVMRVGRVRELRLAVKKLYEIFLEE